VFNAKNCQKKKKFNLIKFIMYFLNIIYKLLKNQPNYFLDNNMMMFRMYLKVNQLINFHVHSNFKAKLKKINLIFLMFQNNKMKQKKIV